MQIKAESKSTQAPTLLCYRWYKHIKRDIIPLNKMQSKVTSYICALDRVRFDEALCTLEHCMSWRSSCHDAAHRNESFSGEVVEFWQGRSRREKSKNLRQLLEVHLGVAILHGVVWDLPVAARKLLDHTGLERMSESSSSVQLFSRKLGSTGLRWRVLVGSVLDPLA